ncbi:ribbon-helix-helix domain-containing protein [Bosea sp. (in: a-proteobacteria)]|jgi:Arc/MetJ-type ribon-helix-helix transcriptional regulator|uniref:ribbon-helix-helix domain-containing protein n=1 Tax=Bosea sp. (in: a-proteobacteria) TaxID=1871050 RepID=UPI004033DCC8
MAVKLPPDIAELVTARVESGDFASPEEVLRAAMAPWIAREQARAATLDELRAKIAEGDADPTDETPDEIRDHLDRVAASLQRQGPNAA